MSPLLVPVENIAALIEDFAQREPQPAREDWLRIADRIRTKGFEMTANYLAENDFLLEAGDILAGRTRKLPTLEHLRALEQLLRQARVLLVNLEQGVDPQDWLREAAKALSPAESSASQ